MEFEEHEANHSQEEQEVEALEQELDTEIDNEIDPEPEGEFDVIKYNKEEIKIPVADRQTYLQKGYNYDKVKTELDTVKQQTEYLNRLATMSGYNSTEDFIAAVEEAEQLQQMQEEAQRMGVDEDTYREYFQPVNNEVSQLRNQLETLQRQEVSRQVEAEVNSLKEKYADFDQYERDVFELAMQGYKLEDAYKLVSYEDKLNSIGQQKEQEVLAKITGRDQKQVLSSTDQPHNTQFDPDNMSLEDIQKLSERVQRGERITF
jgi:hypothetical protein